MSLASFRLLVVGGGILGTMHAVEGARRGYAVTQLERDLEPRGASVRNFGLIWVSGRAPGDELALALRARERWEEVALLAPAAGFRAAGSVTVACDEDELAALELAAARPDATARGFRLATGNELRAANPGLRRDVLGGLVCSRDAIVEPRLALRALRDGLETTGSYTWLPGRHALDVRPHGVLDHTGTWHEADLVVCCPGAYPGGFLGERLEGAPLRRIQLQMLETAPYEGEIRAALADADSLRYYPAFAGAGRERLAAQGGIAAAWRAQLLLVKRLSGHLTIGDTHADEPFPFDLADEPTTHLLSAATRLLGPLPPVERRWSGVYSQASDDRLYFRTEVEPGVVVVTGAGGRGMTLAPAIAEETFQ